MILLFLFFLYWTVSVFNAGQLSLDKIRVQNGADVAAMVHADWTARALNTMSMNNVALSQNLVALVASASVVEAELDLGARALETGSAILAASAVCQGFPPCVAYYVARAAPAFATAAQLYDYERRYEARKGVNVARSTIEALNRMNDDLVRSMPRVAGDAIRASLGPNDIDAVFVHKPCETGDGCGGAGSLGRDLPVDTGARALAYLELCDAAENGSDGRSRLNYEKLGYPRDKGPLKAGGSRDTAVKDYISRETGLGLIYQQFYAAYPFPEPYLGTTVPPLFIEPQTLASNDFTLKFDRNWKLACFGGVAGGVLGLGSVVPTPYGIRGALPGVGALGSRFEDADDFKILAIAARKRRRMAVVDLFEQAMDTDYAYAQSWVFNPSSADLYTQDWQGQSSPATFMDRPAEVAGAMQGRAPGDFRDLQSLFRRSGNADAFKAVNQH
jgi:hypothetical protein